MDNELYDDNCSSDSPDDEHGLQSNIPTEAQLCVQRMLGKQLDTDISLEQYTVKHKSFTPAVTFRPFIEQASGQLSLEQFEGLEKEHRGLDELRACGLTDQEIALKLENEGRHLSSLLPPSKRGHFLADPVARRKRLKAVEEKIHQKKASLGISSEESCSHHQVESRDTGGEEGGGNNPISTAHLVRHPTTLGMEYIHPDDPINHLDEIAAGLFGKSKDKQDENVSSSPGNAMSRVCGPIEDTSGDEHRRGLNKGWTSSFEGGILSRDAVLTMLSGRESHSGSEIRHLANTPREASSPEARAKTEISNHAAGDWKWQSDDPGASGTCSGAQSGDNKPRRLASLIIPLSREDLSKHSLTEDDICKMDRFRDYSAGQPSKVLFLKNLSAKVTEEDLASVFICFQQQDEPKIIFKLLKGRMKGQAFVTFGDAETATEAMAHINGYPLKGKPMIIQYGKQR